MYFKRLEMFGFKSFADKTILNFEPGITAVVGPNGCGKSNIFDAVRWVLGEQSVKELRGSAMEDVIFNGTDSKQGLGFAEVHLVFSNESKILPIEYNEVTVTRRLFRSGESEYLLNKTVVRLKDILELFMGTGVGAEAYSLVQQGKVDLVVSARPEDRRIILDEASGITKYKSRKREALNKLKETENNLIRINDIILEVKRQIGSIERQASKARRYKEEFEKLKTLETQLARQRLLAFVDKKNEMIRFLQELKDRQIKLKEELDELNNIVTYESSLLSELEQKMDESNTEEMKLASTLEINARQIEFNEERLENLALNETRLNQQKTTIIERCRQQQEKIQELNQGLTALNTMMERNLSLIEQKKQELGQIVQAIELDKTSIKTDEEKILTLTSHQVRLKNELSENMKDFQGALAKKRRLELENVKVAGEKEEIDGKLRDICAEITITTKKNEELKREKEAKSGALSELNLELKNIDQELVESEKKKVIFLSQKAFTEELRVQYQDIPDPIVNGRLITSVPPLENQSGIIGKVKEFHPFDLEKYPSLKESATFGPESKLYEIICEAKFIELDPQQFVSKIEVLDQKIQDLNVSRGSLCQKISEAEQGLELISKAFQIEEKNISIFEAQKNDILENSSKLLGELEIVNVELEEVQKSLAIFKVEEDELISQLNNINQETQLSQTNIKDRQISINRKSQQKEEVAVAIAQSEIELQSVKDKEQSLQDNLRLFTESLEDGWEEIKRIDEENSQYALKRQKIEDEIAALKDQIERDQEQQKSLKDTLRAFENQRNDVTQRLNSIRGNMIVTEGELAEIKNQEHQQQMKEQELLFSEREIKDRLAQVYKLNLDELLVSPEPSQEPVADAGEFNSEENLLIEIERLKKRCESFGSVNLVAIEEFEELRQRFEFLTKQQSDLLTSKESIHQTISKINRTTRQMFMDTFMKVSEEFRIYFRALFGGGEAQLVLLDPENVLESGIEIIARPPGKKLQNIGLLSGGEKTLTAIALIFGVFKVRPSPFCVLDEIDAALDESNVGRFAQLLKEFAKIAQFIVITHNKKTIAYSDIMYGITMQETGVSKIVSVKFREEKKVAVAEAEEVSV